MKKITINVLFIAITAFLMSSPPVFAQFGELFKDLKEAVVGEGTLSTEKIIQGLKEALTIGSEKAIRNVSRMDGFYKNPSIKIPLPESIKKVEGVLRTVGYGEKVDEFELSMNRAAEEAAPEAQSFFIDTIKDMSIADAKKILQGRDNEATLYFEDKTRGKLTELFMPIVEKSMSKVGSTRAYQSLQNKVKAIPFTESINMDLEQYVTDGALDGLFKMLAREEAKIRQDPSARVTDILKEVFGNR